MDNLWCSSIVLVQFAIHLVSNFQTMPSSFFLHSFPIIPNSCNIEIDKFKDMQRVDKLGQKWPISRIMSANLAKGMRLHQK